MLYFLSGASGGTPKKTLAELLGERCSTFMVDLPRGAAYLLAAWLLIGHVGDVDMRFAVDAGAFGLSCGFGFPHGGNAPTELSGAP